MSPQETNGPILRLTQSALDGNRYRVEIALEAAGEPRRTANSEFSFKLETQDQEDIRWYLEDYLVYPIDPRPKIAERIQERMAEIGKDLFRKIFPPENTNASGIWFGVRDRLENTRVEIVAGVREATAIPWELMRDPTTDAPLALGARAFVRASYDSARTPVSPDAAAERIRILLVICRPSGRYDVPFRSVASRLIRGLEKADRETFQLDMLRPPTYEALAAKLRTAKNDDKPYHIVHFDGHGDFLDLKELLDQWKKKPKEEIERLLAERLEFDPHRFSPESIYPHTPRAGQRGYLVFNNPQSAFNRRLVDGPEIGKLLADTKVPVLVLNACRSAHAEAPEKPETAAGDIPGDVHAQVRTYGSLAQEIMDSGAAGVVAMRYNVYVVTAAQFVADLYGALVQGQTLGQAVTLGRKQLAAQPLREISFNPLPLQDWCVPLVHEATRIALFPKPAEEKELQFKLKPEGRTAAAGEAVDSGLPPSPDVGFFGRDETLLALDHIFDTQSIVLLHAFAGSGKTATAAEFARWYALTGGVEGAALFTSFEQQKPLVRVLDQFGQVFGPTLEQSGIHWLTLEDKQRRDLALQVLKQVPVLWIWDNVEPVTGFPKGTKSAWSPDEQNELVDFLRAARETKAKFLLTSRRDERVWLGDLPARVTLPPMPMQERVQIARAIAEKHNRRLTDVADWRPLLRFTEGNPLTLTVVVGQAFRAGIKKPEEIGAFVEKLRSGEAQFEDDETEGRSKSLGASLSYGFQDAFTEEERKILALLHFFQGFVDVKALLLMGNPKAEWCLPEVRGLTREAGIALLDRAAEIGLLTAHGGGYYSIHPALPWFFKSLFEEYYPVSDAAEAESSARKATRAYVEAMGELGDYYAGQYEDGNRDVIGALTAEEANLLHARRLARANGWWGAITSAMQGLLQLYDHTGRWAEWKRLVMEIVTDFVDVKTDGPLPGREEDWSLVTGYRVRLTRESRQWNEGERLQEIRVDWNRKRAEELFSIESESLNGIQRNAIRTLAVSLHELGRIQTEQGRTECEKSYQEALELATRIGDKAVAAMCALNLGHSYMSLPDLRNLDKAATQYQRILELTDERDKLMRAKCAGQLGAVDLERFEDAREAGKPEKEILRHLKYALGHYNQALNLHPSDAVGDLAVTHNQLGLIYRHAGDLEHALPHYSKCIQYMEEMGDLFQAGRTRGNVAVALAGAGRLDDALLYAQAALRNFETYGERAINEIQKTKELIAQIKKDIRSQGANPNP